jgi:hypothetical protein
MWMEFPEELQTLVFLILEKLHTTHDADRLKLFGNALCNAARLSSKTIHARIISACFGN